MTTLSGQIRIGSDHALISNTSEMLQHRKGSGAAEIVFTRQLGEVTIRGVQKISIDQNVPCMPALVSVLPPDSEAVRLVRPLLANLRAVRYYPLSLEQTDVRSPIVSHTDYNEWLASRGHVGSLGTSIIMRLLDMKLKRPEQFNEVQELLGPRGLGVIQDIHIEPLLTRDAQEKEKTLYYIVFQTPSHLRGGGFPFEDLSSGTQKLIAIITALLYDESVVMLLEHPEDGIHRALLKKLLDILRSYSDRSQLIMASHSAVVFNTVKPGSIRLVEMDGGKTQVRALTPNEVQAAAQYLEEEGTLADFLELAED